MKVRVDYSLGDVPEFVVESDEGDDIAKVSFDYDDKAFNMGVNFLHPIELSEEQCRLIYKACVNLALKINEMRKVRFVHKVA
jgi:hypothetical protein